MIETRIMNRRAIEVPCTVEIEHTPASLHAHVDLDGDIVLNPGDEVLVHGAPDRIPFGESYTGRCQATVIRARWYEQIWTKLLATLEFTELYEVSFTPRRTL